MRKEEKIWRGWGEDRKFNFRLFKFDMSIRPPSIDVEKVVRVILGFRGHIHPGEINESHQHIGGIFKHKISCSY